MWEKTELHYTPDSSSAELEAYACIYRDFN